MSVMAARARAIALVCINAMLGGEGKAVEVDYSFEAAETQNRKPSRQVGAKNAVLRFRVRLDGPATPGALVGQLSLLGTMRVSRSETRSILGPPVPARPTLASTRPIA